MEKQIEQLTKRIEVLEKQSVGKPAKKEKREPSEKQKARGEKFKKVYAELKKENPEMNHKELFSQVQKKIKEEKS